MSLVLRLRLQRYIHLCRSHSNIPRLPLLLKLLQNLHLLLNFGEVQIPLCQPHTHKMTIERPKVVRTCGDFSILISARASGRNAVHFFIDLSTSKSVPKLTCFAHFDFRMCFAPQRMHFFDTSTSKSALKLQCFYHFDFEARFALQLRDLFAHIDLISTAFLFSDLLSSSLLFSDSSHICSSMCPFCRKFEF